MKKVFKKTAFLLALAPLAITYGHANPSDNQSKIAIAKKVISNLDQRIPTILSHADNDFSTIANYAEFVAERDNYISCAPWDWIGGQDYVQSRINRSANYTLLKNGQVRARFNVGIQGGKPVEVVDFAFIKQNGRYVISDIIVDDISFIQATIECLQESDYI